MKFRTREFISAVSQPSFFFPLMFGIPLTGIGYYVLEYFPISVSNAGNPIEQATFALGLTLFFAGVSFLVQALIFLYQYPSDLKKDKQLDRIEKKLDSLLLLTLLNED